ncbi:MAG: UTRA domain-containing protein [Holdemanella sp.]|nr:UTRA domain-containing protein [Holdemanella sp.]
MPKSKYEDLYKKIKRRIETGEYEYQSLLPSENTFVHEFESSRNTIRRAIMQLVQDGYVQTIHGKGVRVIYEPQEQSIFTMERIESFSEASSRLSLNQVTEVREFKELVIDEKLSKKTGFEIGKEIYYVQRLRIIDDIPLIIDHNYFLKDVVPHLTREIAESSIYNYLENELHVNIMTSKRKFSVEPANENDENNILLNGLNCVMAVTSTTYDSNGIFFEYTQSRHSPKHFAFYDVSTRQKT